MSMHRRLPWFLSGFLLVAFLAPLEAQQSSNSKPQIKKPVASKFMRITKDDEGQPLALETAIVRYKSASGEGDLVVDLVSVVHIGERAYYQKLNKQFTQYDALL